MRMTLDSFFDLIALEQRATPNLACPRCGRNPVVHPLVRNALSRLDPRVHVCSQCGVDEAFSDEGKKNALDAAQKWHVRKVFGIKLV
jgi:predicted RNA-binding Zn-ribbon protein involved in translation (DUF1610 family)